MTEVHQRCKSRAAQHVSLLVQWSWSKSCSEGSLGRGRKGLLLAKTCVSAAGLRYFELCDC